MNADRNITVEHLKSDRVVVTHAKRRLALRYWEVFGENRWVVEVESITGSPSAIPSDADLSKIVRWAVSDLMDRITITRNGVVIYSNPDDPKLARLGKFMTTVGIVALFPITLPVYFKKKWDGRDKRAKATQESTTETTKDE